MFRGGAEEWKQEVSWEIWIDAGECLESYSIEVAVRDLVENVKLKEAQAQCV